MLNYSKYKMVIQTINSQWNRLNHVKIPKQICYNVKINVSSDGQRATSAK